MYMKEISFLIFAVLLICFLLSTKPYINEFRTKKSLYSVIVSLEQQGKPGAKRIKYLFVAVMISLGAFFVTNWN
jgi:hypothetical protein